MARIYESDVVRIGVLLASKQVDLASLKYFIVAMNKQQRYFEYEILPVPWDDEFIKSLNSRNAANRNKIRDRSADFLQKYKMLLRAAASGLSQQGDSERFVVITLAKFHDNYYSLREGELSIIALGHWKRAMAPPSVLEFIQTLIVRESLAHVCPSLSGSVHLGTRGCICDFTPNLRDARLKVMSGFICRSCRKELAMTSEPSMADDIQLMLQNKWVGKLEDPASVASVLAKLKSDLFLATGLKPSFFENILLILHQDGAKELLRVAGGIVLAAAVFYLGFKSGS